MISIDERGPKFTESLFAAGYSPVSLSDLGETPTSEGADVFTVGYLDAVSSLPARLPHSGLLGWHASVISQPNFSFGRVSMLDPDLPVFWTDMSSYPGNSGGPVVEDGRLVGVVSAQASVAVDFEPDDGSFAFD